MIHHRSTDYDPHLFGEMLAHQAQANHLRAENKELRRQNRLLRNALAIAAALGDCQEVVAGLLAGEPPLN